MKQAGILTKYYNSMNYGGVLQAYALNRYLRERGGECETICYDHEATHSMTAVQRSRVKTYQFLKQLARRTRDLLNQWRLRMECPGFRIRAKSIP